ncbi:MAG: phosphoribosylamine--glycine ligase, partial [Gemmatimonadales bacterium]
MNVLIVGGGGREHALGWWVRRDAPDAAVFFAPGNPGTALHGTNLPIPATDLDRVVDAARTRRIDLVIVGPEAPLAAGLADRLRAEGGGIAVFGPSGAAAQIEASKAFAKEVMDAAGVPTARWEQFTDFSAARDYIRGHAAPLVVKASGLAAGKGAVVCATRGDAEATARAMLVDEKFGDAGRVVVVEEFLDGEELSVLALTDGEHVATLPVAQDHKRLGDGDTGPNTGGMGAYAPVSLAGPRFAERVKREVMLPTIRELANRGALYQGVLYAGLMLRPDGRLSVLEFNCRFGDPEAQAVLPILPQGVLRHLHDIAAGRWKPPAKLDFAAQGFAVTTVLAARGYPDAPEKGAAIALPATLPETTLLFHAGTARDAPGQLRVAGGRVLNATGLGRTLADAAA